MEKTRNLSVAEYYAVIQREYLIAEFRKKIYYNPKDKNYYQRVMKHKADKINDIAKRNHLDSIFNSVAKMEEVRSELFDVLGKPRFDMTQTDIENYYAVGNEFSFRGEAWILDQVNNDGTFTIYSPKLQQYEKVKNEEICRIL